MPAKTPEASMAGAKRAPSSLVQLVTTIGCFVLMPRSLSVRIDLEPAEHAEHAVVAPAGRLRVEMAADIDRQRVAGPCPRGAANMVPILSTPIVSPAASHQRLNRCAALAVVVGQRLAVVAAGNARADLRQSHGSSPTAGRH